MSKSPGTKWKVVASGDTKSMGSSDEGVLCGIGCWAGKVMGKVGNYIMGSGYDPKLSEQLSETVGETLKSKNVVLYRNPSRTHEVILHKVSEGDKHIAWSVREQIVN
tara:strand:+ start:166 stop:486 length:321 start_codon:yes stop_codon:yes gene_type:complete